MDEFVRTGSDLKNAKLIIIDARSNSGGDEDFIKNWLKSYTGEEPEQKTIISNWGTAMFDRTQAYADLGEEFAAFRTGDKDYELFQGKLLENSTPILLLTDSMSGSAGESIVTYCRTLDNCLVIGGPTRGAQLVGNVRDWMLPNSAIGFQFGQALHFIYSMENVEGKGYAPAEANPGNFHGVSTFDLVHSIPDPEVAPKESFSTVFGNLLNKQGSENEKICAITAAMKYGTGLQFFYHTHPKRFFDVGMAEQHAVTFAAGLASQGMLPVVCIYSTFLQRSYDQIIHDVNLLKENVVFAIDRAGFVPADGETHQGIYDPAFLSQVGMPIYSPSNYAELKYWLPILLSNEMQGPRAIRYPRGGESKALAQYGCSGKEYDHLYTAPGAKIVLVSYADEVEDVLNAAKLLGAENIPCDVYKLVKIFPFTEELIREIMRYDVVLMAEECVACGGIGEHLEMALQHAGWNGRYIHTAVEQLCLPHATVPQIKQATGLDAVHLAEAVQAADPKGEKTL